jgi:nucleoside-diphosphate-sugar epimerase
MKRPGRVLVTGAAGQLGTAVCRALIGAGYDVRAADRRFVPDHPARLIVGDLLDEQWVYGVAEGCDKVVHLGNHPNMFVGLSPQQILSDNVRMNANVFLAAAHLGAKEVVYASSVQVMLRSKGGRCKPPYAVPYLPLDGNAPQDPGTNTYAMSKEFGERLLSALCQENSELCATSLRFPMLPEARWADLLRHAHLPSPERTNAGECFTHLLTEEAASLVERVLCRPRLGYRQYFPAWSMEFRGITVAELYRRYFSHVPLRRPLEELTDFVDLADLKRDFDWQPKERITVSVEELDQ